MSMTYRVHLHYHNNPNYLILERVQLLLEDTKNGFRRYKEECIEFVGFDCDNDKVRFPFPFSFGFSFGELGHVMDGKGLDYFSDNS